MVVQLYLLLLFGYATNHPASGVRTKLSERVRLR